MPIEPVNPETDQARPPERLAVDLAALGRLLGEHLPLPAAATQGDAHVLRWVNAAFGRLAGAPAGELVGRPFLEALPSAATDGTAELLERVFRTGQEAFSPEPGPAATRAPGGTPARSLSVAPLFGGRGRPAGLLVRVDDTTELMLARERAAGDELREANRRLLSAGLRAEEQFDQAVGEVAHLNALLESLHEAVVVADSAGRVRLMNPAARVLFGVVGPDLAEAPAVFSQLDRRLPDGTPLPPDRWPMARAVRGERFGDVELILVRPDGARLRVLSSGSAVRDDRGEIVLAVVVDRDVTALRELEQRKEEYLALISHDLRSPLTAVIAEAQLVQRRLLQEGRGRAAHARLATSIIANARRMDAMIQELLETSRLESGTAPLRTEPVELVRLVEGVVERVGADRVRVQALAGGTWVSVDAGQVERVLINLVGNALKYSPPDSPVVVRVGRAKDEALVSVADRGAGIAPDELSRLFRRFTRLRAGPPGDVEGIGLGLYIARLIVEAHGGRIWAESDVGEGSTFTFSLPLGPSGPG
ncbi:MAG TPA: ATP-binding protein [Solirubrobacteraceae bacterium]